MLKQKHRAPVDVAAWTVVTVVAGVVVIGGGLLIALFL